MPHHHHLGARTGPPRNECRYGKCATRKGSTDRDRLVLLAACSWRRVPCRGLRRPAAFDGLDSADIGLYIVFFLWSRSRRRTHLGRSKMKLPVDSLFGQIYSLLGRDHFPVPAHREIARNALEQRRESSPAAAAAANGSQNSLLFSLLAGNSTIAGDAARAGRLERPHGTNFSAARTGSLYDQ
jgi:hypothetical protein